MWEVLVVKGLSNFQHLSIFERFYCFDQKYFFPFDYQNFFCFDVAKSESDIFVDKRFLDFKTFDSFVDSITAGHVHVCHKH